MKWTQGYIKFRRVVAGESRWYVSHGREFGLWWFDVRGFGLMFEAIGPFRFA